jgi:hypothetical protein
MNASMRSAKDLLRLTLFLPMLLAGANLGIPKVVRSDNRSAFIPRLRVGQTMRYETGARLERHVKSESRVVTLLGPREVRRDLSTGMLITIKDVKNTGDRPTVSAVSELDAPDDKTGSGPPPDKPTVNFTIEENGQLGRAEGLDRLEPEQRLAWQFWIARFAYGWTLPAAGVKPGEKWKSEEPEETPSPMAGLVWERETTYVQTDKCPILPTEVCAVFLTDSKLKQKSSPEDTTPEDYQRQELKTFGTAKGTNQTVSYISLTTGLVLRATEDVQQYMDVTVAKADASNQVRYEITVTSHFETVFVPQAAGN